MFDHSGETMEGRDSSLPAEVSDVTEVTEVTILAS